jgi:CopG family transcriptional regulator, nickel-responsive regulator
MQRVTITLDDDLMAEIDAFMQKRNYQSRSEAFRDLARSGLQRDREETGESKYCFAALVYAFDHEVRNLAKRLADTRRQNHDLIVSAVTVDLDHVSSLEVILLKGATEDVRRLAAHVMAERGVRHGRLVIVPVEKTSEVHPHGSGHTHRHDHYHVRQAG